MALRNIKPRIGTLSPPLRRTNAHGHDERSEVRGWYKSAEWQALRRRVFKRDNYTCQGCGQLARPGDPVHGPVADHKKPHRGNRVLFFDPENVETLGKSPCHDQVKQRQERADRGAGG